VAGGDDPEHLGVAQERARPDAEHHPAPGQVIEQDHPVGDHQRVVVGQADDAGAEHDFAGPLRRDAHEHFWRSDGLPAGAVVLADPGFVVVKLVEHLDQPHVALE
jgi:hypothetical protein